MLRIQNSHRKYIFLVAFFSIFSLLLYGVALGGEGTQGGNKEATHKSSDEGAHEGDHEEDRSGDYLDLLYRFINFALLVIILAVVLKKSNALSFFSTRVEEIKEKLDNLKKEREEAEGSYRDIEKRLKDFEEERRSIIEQAKKDGEAEKDKIISEARERVKQIIEQAELTIKNEMESASNRLKQEVMDLAAQRAQEIIAREMTDDDQEKLINEFIERVGKIH